MPRPPRFSYAQALHHVTLRCNNREFLFADPWFADFAQLLQETRAKFRIKLFSYCVMTNHVHMVVQVPEEDTLSKAMHWLSTTFVRRFNRATGRCGHLWQGRFRSAIIEESSYFLRCLAYVDLNPVRAAMVSSPGAYPWCSHGALREKDPSVLDIGEPYLGLGADAAERYERYREFLAEEASRPPVSLAKAYFVGTPRFVGRMAARFGLAEGGRSLRRMQLGSGLMCVEPLHGRAQASDYQCHRKLLP